MVHVYPSLLLVNKVEWLDAQKTVLLMPLWRKFNTIRLVPRQPVKQEHVPTLKFMDMRGEKSMIRSIDMDCQRRINFQDNGFRNFLF